MPSRFKPPLAAAVALLLLFAGKGHAFFPEDPYFFPGTGSGASDGFYGQWHLWNQMPLSAENPGMDVNIRGAWDRGLTGSGVAIGVLDTGVEGDHPDLEFHNNGSRKFLNEYSWSFEVSAADNRTSAYRGAPSTYGEAGQVNAHGTAVAGVAAAAGNQIGGVGAAPGASLASLQIEFFPQPVEGRDHRAAMAAALLYQGQRNASGELDPYAPIDWAAFGPSGPPVRVKNMSLGPNRGFSNHLAFGRSQEIYDAVSQSAANGVIHVAAAGNSRDSDSGMDANRSFLQSHPRTINVGALGADGRYANYSSYGANLFVTAPSGATDLYSITTTDRVGEVGYNSHSGEPYLGHDLDYTSTFNGTSSAAPLVAGIMALGVEANPMMDVRMAQHLLVRTSRIVDSGDASETGGWITNQAGFHFNSNYGFGLIDAGAFTEMATQVADLSAAEVYQTGVAPIAQAFDVPTLSYSVTMEEDAPLPLEYVRVTLKISGLQGDFDAYLAGEGAIAGDLRGVLTSAAGTSYTLFWDDSDLPVAEERAWQTDGPDYDDLTPLPTLEWSFTSFAYWGESLNGTWTLEITNLGQLGMATSGFWEEVSFEFGTGEIALIPEPTGWSLLAPVALLAFGARFVRTRKRRATA